VSCGHPTAFPLHWRDPSRSFLVDQHRHTIASPRSCCTFCPFASLKGTAIERLRQQPEQLAHALMVEYTSLCFNHRSTFYKTRSLISLIREQNNSAIHDFQQLLAQTTTAIYRVRRIMTTKGHRLPKNHNTHHVITNRALRNEVEF